jgi:hypothetical protein
LIEFNCLLYLALSIFIVDFSISSIVQFAKRFPSFASQKYRQLEYSQEAESGSIKGKYLPGLLTQPVSLPFATSTRSTANTTTDICHRHPDPFPHYLSHTPPIQYH